MAKANTSSIGGTPKKKTLNDVDQGSLGAPSIQNDVTKRPPGVPFKSGPGTSAADKFGYSSLSDFDA